MNEMIVTAAVTAAFFMAPAIGNAEDHSAAPSPGGRVGTDNAVDGCGKERRRFRDDQRTKVSGVKRLRH